MADSDHLTIVKCDISATISLILMNSELCMAMDISRSDLISDQKLEN